MSFVLGKQLLRLRKTSTDLFMLSCFCWRLNMMHVFWVKCFQECIFSFKGFLISQSVKRPFSVNMISRYCSVPTALYHLQWLITWFGKRITTYLGSCRCQPHWYTGRPCRNPASVKKCRNPFFWYKVELPESFPLCGDFVAACLANSPHLLCVLAFFWSWRLCLGSCPIAFTIVALPTFSSTCCTKAVSDPLAVLSLTILFRFLPRCV